MYEAIKKIKDEENIIKDIDFNIIMEVIIFPNIYSSARVVGSFFDIKKISKSNMYVDGEEVELNNEVNLETNKQHSIKVLLEGKLEDASYLFNYCENREIKFYKSLTETKRRIFDKSNINKVNYMFHHTSNFTIDVSFFNTKNVLDMENMFAFARNSKFINIASLDTNSVTSMENIRRFIGFIFTQYK